MFVNISHVAPALNRRSKVLTTNGGASGASITYMYLNVIFNSSTELLNSRQSYAPEINKFTQEVTILLYSSLSPV